MFAEVTVWNLNDETLSAIQPPTQGFSKSVGKIVIQAGYVNGNYGQIYSGQVFQTRVIHENVVDKKLVLNCIDGLQQLMNNYVSMTFSAGVNQQTVVKGIASQAQQPIEIGTLSDSLNSKQLPRGKVVFGEPKKFFREISQDNNGQFYFVDGQLNLTTLLDIPKGQSLIIQPPPIGGLIGYPEQVDGGVKFTVLLNPLLKLMYPPMSVTLMNTVINQQQVQYGSGTLPYVLSPSGEYKVVKVVHHGDTRGNDWYTECVAVTPGMLPITLTQSPN